MGFGPFFVCAAEVLLLSGRTGGISFGARMARMADIVETTLHGMGYETVDVQAGNHGRFVRIFIDRPEGITVDDCAAVSRHLTRVFAVEGVDYDRLEVSSPGLDRPLRKAADFVRFAGEKADIRMRLADASGRKRFMGVLRGMEGTQLKIESDSGIVLLELDDVDRAKLVPDL